MYAREAQLELEPLPIPPDMTQEASAPTEERPDDLEALLVERFAASRDSSSESDEAPTPVSAQQVSFSLFQNGLWGAIHACKAGESKAACGASKTSAPSLPPKLPRPLFADARAAPAFWTPYRDDQKGSVLPADREPRPTCLACRSHFSFG